MINGVNTEKFFPFDATARRACKKKYGFENKTIVLVIGSVCERKNQLEAIHLLEPMLKTSDNLVYVYFGGVISDDYQASIVEFAKSHNLLETRKIFYAGETDPTVGINEAYNLGDAFFFPSTAEAFPLVIMEAMASGLPVIVDAACNFPFTDNCLTYGSPEQLHEIINDIIANEEKRLEYAEKALKLIRERYSWDSVAALYIEQFNALNPDKQP